MTGPAADASPSIRLEGLSFAYSGGADVLRGISASFAGRGAVALLGANGAGKSTLLRLLVGLVRGHRGSAVINGVELSRRNLPAIRAAIGYVFQDADSQLFLATVEDNVAFGPQNTGHSRGESEALAMRAMEEMGIEALAPKRVYSLSGGQKRLAAIATVLSMNPSILLLDEPSSGLDPRNRRRLIDRLAALPCLSLVATHDLGLARDLCGRVVILSEGSIAADGAPGDLLGDEALLRRVGLDG